MASRKRFKRSLTYVSQEWSCFGRPGWQKSLGTSRHRSCSTEWDCCWTCWVHYWPTCPCPCKPLTGRERPLRECSNSSLAQGSSTYKTLVASSVHSSRFRVDHELWLDDRRLGLLDDQIVPNAFGPMSYAVGSDSVLLLSCLVVPWSCFVIFIRFFSFLTTWLRWWWFILCGQSELDKLSDLRPEASDLAPLFLFCKLMQSWKSRRSMLWSAHFVMIFDSGCLKQPSFVVSFGNGFLMLDDMRPDWAGRVRVSVCRLRWRRFLVGIEGVVRVDEGKFLGDCVLWLRESNKVSSGY